MLAAVWCMGGGGVGAAVCVQDETAGPAEGGTILWRRMKLPVWVRLPAPQGAHYYVTV